ncbi:hypothetical protein [Absidia glauca]|uniref:Uncharacterized protein n=1 Tax=Absidia glauca TaxID=4829 RepID=A0A163JVF0_ABSGL|nr:hypothetical protein [Absidia glauca]
MIIVAQAMDSPSTDPCMTTLDEQQRDDNEGGYSSKSCQDACASQKQWEDNNGMCVFDRCYCTDVGVGTCQDNNHEGCDAICQNLSLDWVGVCSDGDCHCVF